MDKINPGTGSDLIKALRCLASQDADGDCHMDKYNRYLDNCISAKRKSHRCLAAAPARARYSVHIIRKPMVCALRTGIAWTGSVQWQISWSPH